MKLEEIASGAAAVPLALIGADRELTFQIQERLGDLGLLDPPADGAFGPVSLWALGRFLASTGQGGKPALDPAAARSLLSDEAVSAFPLHFPDTLAGRVAVSFSQHVAVHQIHFGIAETLPALGRSVNIQTCPICAKRISADLAVPLRCGHIR